MNLAGYNGETRMAQYSFETTTITQLTRSRERRRYGSSKTVCTNSTWWRQGNYDPVTGIFRISGESWEVAISDRANAVINHKFIRVTQFWLDTYEEPYWDAVKSTAMHYELWFNEKEKLFWDFFSSEWRLDGVSQNDDERRILRVQR